ncbi:ABC transporter permease [Pseudoalteromonas rubra]|uniref:ABC transporter permease n=1 Tax=Pseudoalteromonas rubra TaxID=43658 RepID=UPI000F79B6E2|nr:FtsX-like permease family protein [Pseudoalteromonas rubra]
MKDFSVILKSLWRSKASPLLLILQIALTFTIFVNAVYMVMQKHEKVTAPSGLNETQVFSLFINLQETGEARVAEFEQVLRDIKDLDSVENAIPVTSVPLSGYGRSADIGYGPADEDKLTSSGYYGSNYDSKDTLDLKLVAGQWFERSDVTHSFFGAKSGGKILVSKALAQTLHPDNWRDVLGKTLYVQGDPQQVIGVVDNLKAVWSFWRLFDHAVLSPVFEIKDKVGLMVRAQPGTLDKAMLDVKEALLMTPGRQIDKLKPFSQTREESYRADVAELQTLQLVLVGLLILTMLAIFGQARFAILKRRKQIGTRRALGANQLQILRYYLLENLIVTLTGVVIGMVCAVLVNTQLVSYFGLTPVPADYLLVGALAILLAGQCAVIQPAWQAARVSPALATRSV